MKEKKFKDRKSGSQTLSIKPVKREELVYGQAEWLVSNPHGNLAHFQYSINGTETMLYYDLTGLTDLKSYLKASIDSAQYRGMLFAIADVLSLCTKLDYPTSAIQFDLEHVYVQPDGTLRFIFIPLTGIPARQDGTPLALLLYLSEQSHVSFVVPDDCKHAAALYDYAKRNSVLSLSSYEEFLSGEFGMAFTVRGASGAFGQRITAGSASPGSRGRPAGGQRGGQGSGSMGARAGATAQSAFDPVSLLQKSPSASDVMASQGMSDRVKDAVAGVSPTAAPSETMAAAAMSRPVGEGTASNAGPDAYGAVAVSAGNQSAGASVSESADAGQAAGETKAAEPGGAQAPGAVEADPGRAQAPGAGTAATQDVGAAVQAAGKVQVSDADPAVGAAGSNVPSSAGASSSSYVGDVIPSGSGSTSLLGARPSRVANAPDGSRQKPCYLMRDRDGSCYQIEDGRGAVVVGRSKSSDIRIDGNSNLSRAHASVRRAGDGFEVTDLGSSNGTFVRGARLFKGQSAKVSAGEAFMLADETMRIVE